MAREHAGEMSKAEKRQALTIPVNFSVSERQPPSGSGRWVSLAAGIACQLVPSEFGIWNVVSLAGGFWHLLTHNPC